MLAVQESASPAIDVSPRCRIDFTLKLTVLLLLLYGGGTQVQQLPLQVVGGAMLLFPAFLHSFPLWGVLAASLALTTGREWYLTDNHKFLITYWLVACALAVRRHGDGEALRQTARVLIALVFSCAVLWKLLAGHYLDGGFFYFTLLVDQRLQKVGAVLAGWPAADVAALRETLGYLGTAGISGVPLVVGAPSQFKLAAILLSWGALVVEALVALVHLRDTPRLDTVRHFSLIAFCLGTYYLMPVPGFASILVILGFAQCRPDDDRMRLRYLIVLACLQFMVLPWQSLLGRLAGVM